MSLQEVREAIRGVIQEKYPTWRIYPHLQAVTQVPAVIIQPSVDVEVPSAEYNHGFGRTTLWYLDLIVLVPYKHMDTSTRVLDEAISMDTPNGIPYLMSTRHSPVLKDTFKTISAPKMRDYGGKYNLADMEHIGACIKLVAEEQCPSTA